MKNKLVIAAALVVLAAVGAFFLMSRRGGGSAAVQRPAVPRVPPRAASVPPPDAGGKTAAARAAARAQEPDAPKPTLAEIREADLDKRRNLFSRLQDVYTADSYPASAITADDTKLFTEALAQLPADEQEVGLQQTLDLLDDSKYSLVLGLTLDRTLPVERLDALFNDVLNRDDILKYPILRTIAAMEGHPMREEAKRILEAVDETDEAKKDSAAATEAAPEP